LSIIGAAALQGRTKDISSFPAVKEALCWGYKKEIAVPFELSHELKAAHDRDSLARQDFVSSLRGFILNDMAAGMKARFEDEIEPALTRALGRPPQTQDEVHAAMRKDTYFKFYSSVRYNAQEMVWRAVIPGVEAALPDLSRQIDELSAKGGGALSLNPDLDIPANVAGLDVHLMPGGYANTETPAAGAVYDNGLAVFSAGFMGPNLDDIGLSMSNYVKHRFPDFHPEHILDCGCTVGHNAAAWARTFPDAEVHGVDVSASVLRYAHGRAQSLGLPVHYHQMDATDLAFEDSSFDVVFTSMFLHELSLKDIKRFFAEAHRVLRPGGLLINMELPPNRELKPYDQFYLDWDCYYNKEPFYRAFRDQDPEDLIVAGGFGPNDYFQFTVPQFSFTEEAAFIAAVNAPPSFDGDTGRLSASLNWFGFGAWKAKT
jgi:SAM-dependent methyltransferase